VFASSSGSAVTYTYTVQAGESDADGITVGAIALGTSTIRDAAGNDAATGLAGHVPSTSGVVVDTAGPVFVDATVNGATLVMRYADASTLDPAHLPATGAFSVTAGAAPVAVSSVVVDAVAHTVTLTLASPVAGGQAVKVAYADPSASNDVNALQDAAGNDAASLAAVAVVNNTALPAPPVSSATVDGVEVQTSTVTNSDGSVSHSVTIPVVTPSRVEQVGNNTVADIPLVSGTSGASLLGAQVPVGIGLQATGAAAPKPAASSVTDLIREIQAHTTGGSQAQQEMTGGGSGFLSALAGSTPLVVQTVVATAAPGAGTSTDHLSINGAPAGTGNPSTALVLDARALVAGTTIELNNVDFVAVIGAVSLTGGAGSQKVWGDDQSQTIFLGADDDILHGGGGNDIVGSAGGNDQIFGDDGNDVVFGGIGDDYIDGGSGYDIVRLAGANRADYSLRVADGKLVMTHLHGGADGVDVVTNVEALRFTDAAVDTSVYGTVNRLAEALTGSSADLALLDAMTLAARNGATLSQVASAVYRQVGGASAGMSDDAFVKALYHNVLDREADSASVTFWTGRLHAGTSRAEVALALANSAEKLAMQPDDIDFNTTDVATLVRLYDALYGRKADAGGLNFWIGAHEGGMAMTDIADAFVATAEGKARYGALSNAQFIDALYHTALHRDAQAGEAQAWVRELDAGHMDRGDVLLAFANSAEHVALIGTISTSIPTL
jgi:uncharacterized repeat protein (TIGR02059 family)